MSCDVSYSKFGVIPGIVFGFRQPYTISSKHVFVLLYFDFICVRSLKAEARGRALHSAEVARKSESKRAV